MRFLTATLLLALSPGAAFALCGGPLNFNKFDRPMDYNSPEDRKMLPTVERAHFTQEVEALIRGINGELPGDIDYTLYQFPNHYRALNAMARWQLKNPRPASATYLTIDCYFERAVSFRPQDATLYFLYAIYLHSAKRLDDAQKAYEKAEELGGGVSPEFHYNYGLLLADQKKWDLAKERADKAYGMGYPLPGLRNKLKRAGVK
jgi:tetratricopeptide (TPR) repeat protein